MSGTLGDRGRALENAFFAKRDQQLLEALRSSLESCQSVRDELAAVSGISDAALLDQLAENGVEAATLAAVVLTPLVEVAWVDYVMDKREKAAILDGAISTGLSESHPCFELLKSWVEVKPGPELLDNWRKFVGELKSMLNDSSMEKLRHAIMHRTREVALAAGGILGMGNRVTAAEQAVLDEIESVLR
jgi:hypothetical protein